MEGETLRTSIPRGPTMNGHARALVGRPPAPAATERRMSGGRALALMALILIGFFGIVWAIVATGQWRQSEQLLAAGLRSPGAAVIMPDGAVIVAEAGLPVNIASGTQANGPIQTTSGRLTWSRSTGARGNYLENLPSQYDPATGMVSGPRAVALLPDGQLLLLMGQCADPRCISLLTIDREGHMTTTADLRLSADARTPSADPIDVLLDPGGTVAYVTDRGRGLLLAVPLGTSSPQARVLTQFAQDQIPGGMTFAADGSLLVAVAPRDTGTIASSNRTAANGAIVRIDSKGTIIPLLDGFGQVIDIAEQKDGTLLVLERGDAGTDTIGRTRRGGQLSLIDPARPTERTVVTSNVQEPTALFLAPDGRVFVSSLGPPSSRLTDPVGEVLQIRRLGPKPPPRRYI